MSDIEDLRGRALGEFVLRELIDEGGFGSVYRCEQPLLGREAVVKVMHQRLRRHDIALKRFLREAQLAARLDHPYAAHVYAFGIDHGDGLFWIAMEMVHGTPLHNWLSERGPMPLEQFAPFFDRVAEVVHHAHAQGIVHRDLKPANVMVIERSGRLLPKLLDFGVARPIDEDTPPAPLHWAEGSTGLDDATLPADLEQTPLMRATATPRRGQLRLTRASAAIGSPPYMSPEQWTDALAVGPASDLYALGVVAYEALTGRRPFNADTADEYVELHCDGKVPPLGGGFPPALDRMFQRALAKRPEDRWPTALALAAALRSASGLGSVSADLPRIDERVRDAWLGDAPQPLAESVAALDGARNAHQARDAAQQLVRTLLRYLVALALVTRRRAAGDDQDDPALLELVRALGKRDLSAEARLQLLRSLARPRGDHPVPELLDLVAPGPDGTDALQPILDLYSIADHSGSEDSVRARLRVLLPELGQLLHKTRFLLDYVLVVPRHSAAERWTGRRQQHRAIAAVLDGELVDGHPTLLDRDGRICADLWPLVQAAPPSDGADPELFLFDGRGPHGAQLIAAPRSIVRDDSAAWKWVATHLIAEVEAGARLGEHLRTAARQWEGRGRSDALLLRGDVLEDLDRWTRHTAAPPLGDLETAFLAASRRAARRRRWGRRALITAGVAAALGVVEYRSLLKTRMVERIAEQAEVEQGRDALLHDDLVEAQLHLEEAYRRGDRSPDVEFMLARALQPRLAEQARFTSTSGHVWSARFSPSGRQIVTTDDRSARLWDATTNRLLFTLPHADIVYSAVFSVDGATLVTASGDSTVKIWSAASGAQVRELTHAGGRPVRYYIVGISPDGKLIAAIDTIGTVVHVWDANTGASLAELRNDGSDYPSLAFSADGGWLATGGGDDVRVFDTHTWASALTITGPRIRALAWDPTGPRLLTGTAGGDASIYEVPSGGRLHHLREVGEPVDLVAFSPDGQLAAAASRDGTEQVWRAGSGTFLSQNNYLRGKLQSIEFDRTSTLVLAAAARGTVVVSEAAQGMPVTVLEGSQAAVRAAHFDPSSRRIVVASVDGTARVWDATSPYRRWSSPPVSDDCGLTSGVDPDRRFIAVGCRDHATRVWDTARDQLLGELPAVTQIEGDFTSALPAVSTAGDRAAIARGNTVEIYALPGGELLRVVTHGAAVNAVAFAPSGHDLVSGAIDGSLRVTRDGRDPQVLSPANRGIDAAAILKDGRVLAAAGEQLRVYEPGRDVVLATLATPTRVGLLRLSPDGRGLITVPIYGRKAGRPVLWDLEHYQLVAQLEGHVGRVFSARFVGGGEILTAGIDGTARRWDGATGQLRQTYRGSTRFLADATLSPDGALVVAGGDDGLLRFWDAEGGRQLWTLPAHRSHVVGVHFEGGDIVTRGFGGDVSRWALPDPERVVEECNEREACAIVEK